jgi:hypothetical protein
LETVLASPTELGVERGMSKRAMLGTVPSQEPKPWRRGRPKKDTENREEDHFSVEPSVCQAIEGFAMLTHWSGLVGTADRGSGRQKEREKSPGLPVESPAQQLEWAQLAIAELCQENKELKSQLAAKNREVSVSQGCEGSTIWLQRWLREAQDTIVNLHEA